MNSQEEYNEFMAKLAFKTHEVQQDYNDLSEENKKKVLRELSDAIAVNGVAVLLDQLAKRLRN